MREEFHRDKIRPPAVGLVSVNHHDALYFTIGGVSGKSPPNGLYSSGYAAGRSPDGRGARARAHAAHVQRLGAKAAHAPGAARADEVASEGSCLTLACLLP